MPDRITITLVCEVCGSRNYKTTRKKDANRGERLELKKHCTQCNAHTLHRESR